MYKGIYRRRWLQADLYDTHNALIPVPAPYSAPLALSSRSAASIQQTGTMPLSQSITVAVDDFVLVWAIVHEATDAAAIVSSVLFNSAAMSYGQLIRQGGDGVVIEAHAHRVASAGTFPVDVTFAGAVGSARQRWVIVEVYAGVNLTTPYNTPAGKGGFTTDIDVPITSGSGQLVAAMLAHRNSSLSITLGAGTTSLATAITADIPNTAQALRYVACTESAAPSVTVGGTLSANGTCAGVALSLIPTFGAATKLSVTTQPASSTSGAVIPTAVQIQLLDANNVPVRIGSVSVTVSIGSGPGALTGTTSAVTDVTGLATFSNLILTGAGTYTLTFASSGLASVTTNSFTVAAAGGTATKLAITTQPSGSITGIQISVQPVIQLQDVNSVNVATASVLVTATVLSGPGVLSGTTTVATDATGKASFTDLVLTGIGATVIEFTSGSLALVDSNPVTTVQQNSLGYVGLDRRRRVVAGAQGTSTIGM